MHHSTILAEWFDSPKQHRRCRYLGLHSDGSLVTAERQRPSDTWPVARVIGGGFHLRSAITYAHEHGFWHRQFSGEGRLTSTPGERLAAAVRSLSDERAAALETLARELSRPAFADALQQVAGMVADSLEAAAESEAEKVRHELHDDPTVSDDTYGRLVAEADESDQRREWNAEREPVDREGE